jgi:uroporphyrinogen-III synthase
MDNVQSAATRWPRAACIGKTSAVACDAANIAPCFFPEQPGMDGWVASVLDALDAPASSAPPLPAASK